MTLTGLTIIIINVVFSYKGLNNDLFFDAYKFEVDKILINKDYKRLITSGFLHVSWMHLIFNMLSLFLFGGMLESYIGGFQFLIIYMVSLVGGNLLSLLVHKYHGDYSSVGASGAVCGIIFASIALFPGFSIRFFMLPIPFPGWLYGILYVLYAIYGVRSKKDNIGHETHLGGALIGMLIALLMHPYAFAENYITILLITVPALAFIVMIIAAPQFLLIDNYFFKTHNKNYTIDQRYNLEKSSQQHEVDRILDKISKKGMGSLTKKEKDVLRDYSQKIK